MNERDDEHDVDALVEQHLVFLRGQGPEPDLGHLTSARRQAVQARIEIVDALFGLEPELPPLDEDPVAIRLGLISGEPGGGSAPSIAMTAEISSPDPRSADGSEPLSWPGRESAHRVIEDLEAEFAGQVSIDWRPDWASRAAVEWHSARVPLLPLGQCSVLGDILALFISSRVSGMWIDSAEQPLARRARAASAQPAGDQDAAYAAPNAVGPYEAEQLALFLRLNPDISSVGLISHDGEQAAIVPAAACNRSVDPLRGWLEPGAFISRDDLPLLMLRYFEQRLPRWERVAGLSEILTGSDDHTESAALVARERDELLRAKPRLTHKKSAQLALREVDPNALSSLITDVQNHVIGEQDFVQRVEALVGDTT